MSERNLTYDDLVQLVELIKSASHFSEFRLKSGDIEVSLKRRVDGTAPRATEPAHEAASPAVQAPAPAATPRTAGGASPVPEGMHAVRAPMVGTFYRAPSPGEPPFAEVGQAVEPDSIVAIIEVMKLMNSIEAGVRGTVREFRVPNATAVEYGEVLVVIEPQP